MYKKISDNKFLKIENDSITKIVLTIEPFHIEELDIEDSEKHNFSKFVLNEKKEYNIEKLEEVSKEDVILCFKNYIINSYDEAIKNRKDAIKKQEEQIEKLKNININYENYAYGNLEYKRKIYAILKDGYWYEYIYNLELNGTFKEGIVEEQFKICSKKDFLKMYETEHVIPIKERIYNLEKIILEYEAKKIKLVETNFDFILR